jgi:hypothetical protein
MWKPYIVDESDMIKAFGGSKMYYLSFVNTAFCVYQAVANLIYQVPSADKISQKTTCFSIFNI